MRGLVGSNEGDVVTYHLTLAAEHPATMNALNQLMGMHRVSPPLPAEPRYTLIFDRTQLTPNVILQTALANGAEIIGFAEEMRHLNQAFMDLTEPGVRS